VKTGVNPRPQAPKANEPPIRTPANAGYCPWQHPKDRYDERPVRQLPPALPIAAGGSSKRQAQTPAAEQPVAQAMTGWWLRREAESGGPPGR
jgi:hypothetical protein